MRKQRLRKIKDTLKVTQPVCGGFRFKTRPGTPEPQLWAAPWIEETCDPLLDCCHVLVCTQWGRKYTDSRSPSKEAQKGLPERLQGQKGPGCLCTCPSCVLTRRLPGWHTLVSLRPTCFSAPEDRTPGHGWAPATCRTQSQAWPHLWSRLIDPYGIPRDKSGHLV